MSLPLFYTLSFKIILYAYQIIITWPRVTFSIAYFQVVKTTNNLIYNLGTWWSNRLHV